MAIIGNLLSLLNLISLKLNWTATYNSSKVSRTEWKCYCNTLEKPPPKEDHQIPSLQFQQMKVPNKMKHSLDFPVIAESGKETITNLRTLGNFNLLTRLFLMPFQFSKMGLCRAQGPLSIPSLLTS